MEKNEEVQRIRRSIRISWGIVLVVFVAIVSFHFYWFVIVKEQTLSSQSTSWGAFGDFIGGILNPLLAFSALYWLTVSVKIQKQELSETRKALNDASKSQAELVEKQVESSKIIALSAIVQGRYQYAAAHGSNSNIRLRKVLLAEQQLINVLNKISNEPIDLDKYELKD